MNADLIISLLLYVLWSPPPPEKFTLSSSAAKCSIFSTINLLCVSVILCEQRANRLNRARLLETTTNCFEWEPGENIWEVTVQVIRNPKDQNKLEKLPSLVIDSLLINHDRRPFTLHRAIWFNAKLKGVGYCSFNKKSSQLIKNRWTTTRSLLLKREWEMFSVLSGLTLTVRGPHLLKD